MNRLVPVVTLAVGAVSLTACGSSRREVILSVDQVAAALRQNHIPVAVARIPASGPATGTLAPTVSVAGWRKYHAVGLVMEIRPASKVTPSGPALLVATIYDSSQHTSSVYPSSKPSMIVRDKQTHRVSGRMFRVENVVILTPLRNEAAAGRAVTELRRERTTQPRSVTSGTSTLNEALGRDGWTHLRRVDFQGTTGQCASGIEPTHQRRYVVCVHQSDDTSTCSGGPLRTFKKPLSSAELRSAGRRSAQECSEATVVLKQVGLLSG